MKKTERTNRAILKRLYKHTHAVKYSPNCPGKFLVHLVGPGKGALDYKAHNETEDILGYGRTLAEAARKAFVQHDAYMDTLKRQIGRMTNLMHPVVRRLAQLSHGAG